MGPYAQNRHVDRCLATINYVTTNEPSKNSVRRAGSAIRRYARGEGTTEGLESAIDVMVAYRSGFSDPLVKVNNALRSFCAAIGVKGDVTQRLKKSNTILSKLSRESGLDLSRMQDIGGCRVVFESVDDLRRVEKLIKRTWGTELHHEKDYINEPRESGYRGVHLIVIRDGKLIEIQLRTLVMHEWAELVEAFSAVTRDNLKQDGSHVIQEYMKLLSKLQATNDGLAQNPVTPAEIDRLGILKEKVVTYLAQLQPELERTE